MTSLLKRIWFTVWPTLAVIGSVAAVLSGWGWLVFRFGYVGVVGPPVAVIVFVVLVVPACIFA